MSEALETRDWQVGGLDCPSCVATLEKACRTVPGVREIRTNLAAGRMRVIYEPARFSENALATAARDAGHPLVGEEGSRHEFGWALAATVPLLLGLGLHLSGTEVAWLYLLAALLGAAPMLPRALSSLRQRRVDMVVLMATAMLGAIGLRDWLEAAVLGVLFAIAQWVEGQSLRRTGTAIRSLLELAPRTARVERSGTVSEVPVEEVAVGERVRVRPGDLIPLDGVIVDGGSAIDEAAVTRESVPADKSAGQRVFAATIALDGALTIEVTARAADSTVAKVVELVETAQMNGSPTARTVDRFAAWYTPLIIGLATLTVVVPVLLDQPFGDWFYRGLVLLVIGCPCALVIATPVAIYSGLTAAAREGILVRGGDPLEAAADLRAVAFDKTGTLTTGRPRLETVAPLADLSGADALAIAAGLEAESSHPLAAAILAAAAARGIMTRAASDHQALPGRGVRATIAGETWWLGNRRLLAEAGIAPAAEARIAELEASGQTVMILAGGAPIALFGLADELRGDAVEAIAQLRAAGVRTVVMLTGDQPASAAALAQAAGIEEVRAGLLPADKQQAIAELERAHGRTAMVGDGINDAPALAAATVGIAIGAAGSPIALETADVALLADDLRNAARLVRLAQRVKRTIVANIVIAFLIRLILIPLAIAGWAPLWLAILGDMGGSLLVTGNSLRLLRRRDATSASR